MKVSVIVPTYNRPDRMVNAVQSCISQTKKPEEVIVINDASSCSYESACGKLKKLSRKSPVKISYRWRSEGGGACKARNEGARAAQGDILMFLDDDDVWEPEKIGGQINIFNSSPEIGLVYSGRKVVDERGRVLYRIRPRAKGCLRREMLCYNVVGTTSGAAIKADAFEKVGGFDPVMPALQDYDLWIRLSQEVQIGYDPNFTVQWRIDTSENTQMTGDPKIYHKAFDLIHEKYSAEIESLDWSSHRKAMAWKYSVLASKYARTGSVKQYYYAVKSLTKFPTVAGASKLIPISLAHTIRGVVVKV